jgi:alkaline phosphatase D
LDRRAFEHMLTHPISRRRFLGAGLATGAIALSIPGGPTRAAGSTASFRIVRHPQFTANPFSLGVASGDPVADGIVLWTRLAPDPANGGGMEPAPVEVRWEIANDDQFKTVVQSGSEIATADLAHSVHVDVSGLEPASDYFYRFSAGGEVSPVARTRTAPATDAAPQRLRFASVSCANYEHGYFSAYRHLAEEDVDFAVCLGDYIYEYGSNGEFQNGDRGAVRYVAGGEVQTLEDYRNRHALYKTDPDLMAAHAAMPWIVTWDDHEVENDYAGEHSEQNDPVDQFLARRANAYQAYYEHMPLRVDSMPQGPDMRLYRRLQFGDLAEVNVLDTRQYRSNQPCAALGPRCEAALDPALSLTGAEQESWLFDGLAGSKARWNVIAQQVMMAQLDGDLSQDGQAFSSDQWDGYPLARQRLLDQLHDAKVSNPVVLTGDIHSSWVADLKLDFNDPASPAVGTEFVTTSVTSFNPYAGQLGFLMIANPHITYYDGRHGYTRCEITPERMTTEYRALEDVSAPDGSISTIASFVVESGKAGAQKN